MATLVFVLGAIVIFLLIHRSGAEIELVRVRNHIKEIVSDLEGGTEKYRQTLIKRLKGLL